MHGDPPSKAPLVYCVSDREKILENREKHGEVRGASCTCGISATLDETAPPEFITCLRLRGGS